MGATVNAARRSPEIPDWSEVGGRQAKAGLTGTEIKQAHEMGTKLWDVLVHGHGGAKEAAFAMGIDRSLLRRKTIEGTLTIEELLQADPRALELVGELFVTTFGDRAKSKGDLARDKIKELILAILDLTAEAK